MYLLLLPLVVIPFALLLRLLAQPIDDVRNQASLDHEARDWWRTRKKESGFRRRSSFQPPQREPAWPESVRQLAAAYAEGADCSFALHDALLEADRPELAEAFRIRDEPAARRVVAAILSSE